MANATRVIKSALYVDFDNVYSGLTTLDRSTAEAFASDPGRLLQLLSRGSDSAGPFERRFLVRDCYLNPQNFAKHRAQFVAAGFRVIDTPSLTQRGKSAADIHIVIDVVDAIGHATRYDEFVICSADADFSPLMTKLRRHDRRTVMVATGNAAPAYEALCDTAIGAMEIVAAVSPGGDEAEDPTESPNPRVTLDQREMAAAADAVRHRVAESPEAVPGPSAAGAALQAVPTIAKSRWAGTGGFAAFVNRYLPELTYASTRSGGLVLDPARHTLEGETAQLDDTTEVIAQVARVTKVPPLTSAQYAVLFRELAEVAKDRPQLAGIGADVRERAADSAAPVSRTSVNSVVAGLVYAGSDPRTAGLGPRGLAEKWLEVVHSRCEQAELELGPDDQKAVAAWILGGLPADGDR